MSTPTLFGLGKKGSFSQKLTALLLVFVFLLTPLTQVLADEAATPLPADPGTATPPPSDVTPPTDPSTPPATPPADQTPADPTVPNPDSTNSSPLPPIISQETSNTSFRLSKRILPQTDLSTGALTYNYPITVPSGRANMTPDISFIYNSQNTDQQNIIGYGWALSIPYISRLNKTGMEKLYTDNYFSSSLDGELVTGNNTDYNPKVESGTFSKYSYSGGYWTVTDKQGTVYTFGQNADASTRQDNTNHTKVYKWMLEKVTDTNNNSIAYTYTKDQNQIYPNTITYTNNGSNTGIYRVEFSKTSRNDALLSYASGFPITTSYVINNITIKTNNTWNRKYDLSYTTGDNGQKSMLASITESTPDVTTLSPTQFTYQKSQTTPGWDLSNGWIFPPNYVDGQPSSPDTLDFVDHRPDAGVRLMDVNKDGLLDFVQSGVWGNQGVTQGVAINNGNNTGWTKSTTWDAPEAFFNQYINSYLPWDAGLRIADVNGDGLPDLVKGLDDDKEVYIHNGSTGWAHVNSWVLPTSFLVGEYHDNGVRMADVNGDGLPDIVELREANGNDPEVTKVYINKGDNTGWIYDANWQIPICNQNLNSPSRKPYFIDFNGNDAGTVLMDINGDGLLDLVQNGYADTFWSRGVSLNKGDGTGWTCDLNWSAPSGRGSNFGDINGDGFLDAVDGYIDQYQTTHAAYMNTGMQNSWNTNNSWHIPTEFTNGASDYGTRLEDVNGDGMPDLVQAINNNGTNIHKVYLNNNKPSDLLASVTLPTGGTNTITYKPSTQYTSNGVLLNPQLPVIIQTVNTITTTDPILNVINTATYSYQGGQYFFNNSFDKKFSGFNKVIESDTNNVSTGSTVTTTFYHQGDSSDSTHGEYNDDEWKIGKPYRVEVADGSGALYSVTINKWDESPVGNNGSKFVKLIQTVDSIYDGNSSHKDKAVTYDYYNETGNQKETHLYGEVNGNNDGTFNDITTDSSYITTITYASNTNNGVIGLPADESTVDQSGAKVSETRHYYDNLSLNQVGVGNETRTDQWYAGTKYIYTKKEYNSYGLVTRDTDPKGASTTYAYDTYNLYPESSTNPLNQTTSYTYNYPSGQVIQTTDPNSRVYITTYDGLGRPLLETQPDPANPSTQVTKSSYAYTNGANVLAVHKTSYLDVGNAIDSYTYFDGLGRKIQERAETKTTGQYAVRDYKYQEGDLLLKESLPYFLSGSGRTIATTNTNLYTNYTYDALKRVLAAITVVGTTSNSYDDWKTTITDADGKTKDIYKDAYDNLDHVVEHINNLPYTTYYKWNGLKKLTMITDANQNVRNFSYDGLGRVLTAEDLHAAGDQIFGTWYYSYDASSNLIFRTDPSLQVVGYTYDALNRTTTEDYTGTPNVDVTYTYDTCTEGIGRLCSVSMVNMLDSKNYNALGQVAQETKRFGKINYVSSYTYDRQGNQVLITNPDNSQVQYIYDAGGQIDQIQRKESVDPSFSNVISNIDYNEVGLPTVLNYANGAITTNTYDNAHLYRLQHKVTVANNSNVQDLTYSYDPVGNITEIIDASNTQTAKTTDYTYDDLYRLIRAQITNSVAENVDGPDNINQDLTFTYDAIGNILSKSDVGNYTYAGNQGNSYANPHAVTSAGGVNYDYDNNGNMTSAGNTQYAWDYNNRLVQVTNGLAGSSYVYDADGQRVKTIDNSGTTLTITKEYTVNPQNIEKHIFLGDTAIATIQGTGASAAPFTIHADHLTGSNVVTDSTQVTDELTDYYAFGTIRVDSNPGTLNEKRKFTGHEYDADTGLTYANARYYNATLGRWLSEDPAFLDLAANDKVEILLVDPQSLNSYSYVKNNPLAYIDPTGEGAIRAYFASWASGLSAAASTLRGPLGSYIGPFGPTGNKVFNEIQASNMSDLSTAINPDSSVKDRAISGGLIALNFVPIGEEAGASEKVAVEMVPKIAKTAEEWGAIAFDAGKQQAKMLRGVANQAVHGLVTKTFQLTDGIIGGTSAAAKYTYETGNLVRGYDHFKKNWNIMKEGMNILQSEVLNSQELKTVKNIINRAWRTNYK